MEVWDFVVVGGGITGLSAAVQLSQAGRVLLVTKEALAESNTSYAQGGIAVAMGGDEDIALHLEDTMAAGDGLVDRTAASVLVSNGPARVQELLNLGTEFDRTSAGELERTREGAHSLSRILHAKGDATGREIARSLLHQVNTISSIKTMEWTSVVNLIHEGIGVKGVTLLAGDHSLLEVRSSAVLLASGGAGQVYSNTTNPAVATGDGIAMAYRAGAVLEDMEFYQFHPTAFALDEAPRFLLSEALRGEGAYLVNTRGERFMTGVHPLEELAPRDVVARAITQQLSAGSVFLDMRHSEKDLKKRFPGISAFLADYGLELGRDLIPVRPAAHYLMGGVKVDLKGRTSLKGLYAAGEAACVGVHGANRLASNSLLEGLVFGAETALTMIKDRAAGLRLRTSPNDSEGSGCPPVEDALASRSRETGTRSLLDSANDQDVEDWIAALRGLMWQDAGLLRDSVGLRRAAAELARLEATLPAGMTRRALEARNLFTLAVVMVQAALAREESRGAHYRLDFTGKWDHALHSFVERGQVTFAP